MLTVLLKQQLLLASCLHLGAFGSEPAGLLESGSSLVLLTLNSAALRLPEVLLIAAWAVMRDALLSAAWTWQRDRLELSFLVSCAYFIGLGALGASVF